MVISYLAQTVDVWLVVTNVDLFIHAVRTKLDVKMDHADLYYHFVLK